ncbi:hypothetical protein EYF80_018625 [Liparis tanakae]|uniref:Uncharacterized protein n=1 Tax=Liparis tanakae TaxID=230148 RepID=A0A4Z2I0J2_9TELE|nr:hypothetical protein EYF80_018625 [Liparis tanakae]
MKEANACYTRAVVFPPLHPLTSDTISFRSLQLNEREPRRADLNLVEYVPKSKMCHMTREGFPREDTLRKMLILWHEKLCPTFIMSWVSHQPNVLWAPADFTMD